MPAQDVTTKPTDKMWDDVQRLADEVELQIHLAGMEARDQWHLLEPRLATMKKTLASAGERASKAISDEVAELAATLRRLRDDVRKPKQ